MNTDDKQQLHDELFAAFVKIRKAYQEHRIPYDMTIPQSLGNWDDEDLHRSVEEIINET